MALLHIAYNNVKENKRSYVSFFASFAFSVMVFYIFHAIATSPEVTAGGYSGARSLREGLRIARWGIGIFSFFFTWYSNSVFTKSRKRDLGVMALVGATSGQIHAMLLLENLLIGISSIVVGLLAGALISRLMAMATVHMLRLDIAIPKGLVVSIPSMWHTVLVYSGIFIGISLLNILSIRTTRVIGLVQAPKKPKSPPKASILLSILAVVCIGGGYYTACILPTAANVVKGMFPVTAVVSLGTYFLFTQLSVVVFRHLTKRRGLYYRNINLITISDLTFQMKDNARVLAMVTILSAAVMTSSGVIYSLGQAMIAEAEIDLTRDIWFALSGAEDGPEIINRYQKTLSERGARIEEDTAAICYVETAEMGIETEEKIRTVWLISEDDYNEWARRAKSIPVSLEPGQAVRPIPMYPGAEPWLDPASGQIAQIRGEKNTMELNICGRVPTNLVDLRYAAWGSSLMILVVHPADLLVLSSGIPGGYSGVIFSCDVENWKDVDRAEKAAQKVLPEGRIETYVSRIDVYAQVKAGYSMAMSIVMFMMFLFFLASGSMLYFRFFLQLQEDREKYTALRRLGLSWREVKTIVSREMAVLFFAPWVVATLHQTFAMQSFATMLERSVWSYGITAALVFLVPQTAYFFAARSAYLSELAPAAR
ncbi:MAG: FtsX-like permease family protein [Limnochordia bacterium]|jgi:putative ABC transport system permease protein